MKNILVDVNLQKNELQNAVIQNLAAPPSNPIAGLVYFDTVSHKLQIYDGTNWIPLSEGIQSLTELGVTATATELNYVDGVTSAIQTQLDNKVAKNNAITGATKTKITYDSKGLVTAGADLAASDIPDISATYVLQTAVGAASGIAELDSNGKVPSSQLPSFVDDVIDSYIVSGATALSAGWLSDTDGGSALTPSTGVIYVIVSSGEYQNKTYRWSGSTYVQIAESPSYATESKAGIAEIATSSETSTGTDDTRIVTPLKLKGVTDTLQPLLVSGTSIKTINSTSLLGSGNISLQTPQTTLSGYGITDAKIDNGVITLGSNTITPLTSHQTLSDLGITATATELNYTDGVTSSIQTQLNNRATVITATNPALTPSGGAVSWSITNSIGTTSVIVQVCEVSSGDVVMTDISISSGNITIGMNASSSVSAGTYRAVIIGM